MNSRNIIHILLTMAGITSIPFYAEESRQRNEPKETVKQSIEDLKVKFFADLKKENDRRSIQFPNWQERNINGVTIVASNTKTAAKQLNYLLKSNGLSIQHIAA